MWNAEGTDEDVIHSNSASYILCSLSASEKLQACRGTSLVQVGAGFCSIMLFCNELKIKAWSVRIVDHVARVFFFHSLKNNSPVYYYLCSWTACFVQNSEQNSQNNNGGLEGVSKLLEDGVIESIRNAMSRYVFKIMRNFNNINLWSSLGFKMVSKLFNFFAKGASKPILRAVVILRSYSTLRRERNHRGWPFGSWSSRRTAPWTNKSTLYW